MIDKRLKPYRENGYRKRFMELKGAQQIKRIIEEKHLPLYLLEEMVEKYLPNGDRNLLINEIAELVGCSNGNKAIERQLAQSAIIPDINNGIELRVVSGLETAKDYILFELIATCIFYKNFIFCG